MKTKNLQGFTTQNIPSTVSFFHESKLVPFKSPPSLFRLELEYSLSTFLWGGVAESLLDCGDLERFRLGGGDREDLLLSRPNWSRPIVRPTGDLRGDRDSDRGRRPLERPRPGDREDLLPRGDRSRDLDLLRWRSLLRDLKKEESMSQKWLWKKFLDMEIANDRLCGWHKL